MRIFSLLLLAAISWPVIAATTGKSAPAGTEPPPEYTVELLIFLRDQSPAGEYWPDDVERPEPGKAVATVTGEAPPEFPPELRVTSFQAPTHAAAPAGTIEALPGEALKLKAHAEALRRQGMSPLIHTAWKQVVDDRDNEHWLWLESGPLYGLVRISRGRYLHIDTDLLLLGPEHETGLPSAIRAKDHRRMRSGELHHLDHPAIGVLVQIDRYEAPRPAAPDAEPLMLEALPAQAPKGSSNPAPGN